MNFMEAIKVMKEGKKVTGIVNNLKLILWKQGDDIMVGSSLDKGTKLRTIFGWFADESINWEIYEEDVIKRLYDECGDNWNLVDKICKCGEDNTHITTKHIKTFIQKVKEDIKKKECTITSFKTEIIEIIDKRTGKL